MARQGVVVCLCGCGKITQMSARSKPTLRFATAECGLRWALKHTAKAWRCDVCETWNELGDEFCCGCGVAAEGG